MKRAALRALACLALSLGAIPAAQALMVDLRQSTPTPGFLDVDVIFSGLVPDDTPPDYANQQIITAYTLVVLTYTYQALTPIGVEFNSNSRLDIVDDCPGDYCPNAESVSAAVPDPDPNQAMRDLVAGYPGQIAFTSVSYSSDAELRLLQVGLLEFNAVTIHYEITTLLPRYEFFFLYNSDRGIDIKGADNIPFDIVGTPEPTPLALLALGALALRLRRRC